MSRLHYVSPSLLVQILGIERAKLNPQTLLATAMSAEKAAKVEEAVMLAFYLWSSAPTVSLDEALRFARFPTTIKMSEVAVDEEQVRAMHWYLGQKLGGGIELEKPANRDERGRWEMLVRRLMSGLNSPEVVLPSIKLAVVAIEPSAPKLPKAKTESDLARAQNLAIALGNVDCSKPVSDEVRASNRDQRYLDPDFGACKKAAPKSKKGDDGKKKKNGKQRSGGRFEHQHAV